MAIIIRYKRLLKEKGLSPDTDVKTLCNQAGISRKTGYQWEKRLDKANEDPKEEDFEHLKADYEKLIKACDDVCWENKGRKIACEIHEVDAIIAEKKELWIGAKIKSRSVFAVGQPT